MTMLVRYVNPTGGSLAVDQHGRLMQGDPLVAAIFASLYTDAPADEGDPAPRDVIADGYWARAFDARAIRGSKLWMLKYVRPVSRAVVLAEQWANEALAWMVPSIAHGVQTIASTPQAGVVRLDVVVTLSTDQRRRFQTDVKYAE